DSASSSFAWCPGSYSTGNSTRRQRRPGRASFRGFVYAAVMTAPLVARAWGELFATRARGGVGEGIADILALLAVPGLISFAGGFPDPDTFPRERAAQLLAEFAESGEASAFQYAPTRGLA